jgi:tetratricopeptide (TPR) repeat protein
MRALAIARRSLSPREVVLALNALAIHRKYTARFQEAGRLYREAFALSMRERPRDPEVLASLLHNLGGLAHARRRYAVAEPLAREAARQRRRALGPDHPDVASDELALAAILEARGAFPEAMRLHLRAIRVLERGGGGAGARGELAIALAGLAALEYRRGRLAPSTRAFRRALLLQARTLGDKHPDVGITLANFALVRLAQGDDAEARRLAARAYRILARSLGRSHPETRASAVVAARVEERARPRRARAGREGTTRPLARRRTNRTGATRSA